MTRTSSHLGPATVVLGLFALAPGCKGDDDEDTTVASATMTASGSESTGSGSSGGESSSSGAESTSGVADSSTGPEPTGGSTDTGPSGDGQCVPDNAPFGQQPPDLPQASISFDFGAQSCSVMGLMSAPPQIVIDVQDSGLLDATGFGIEITDSSPEGLQFSDPPVGDSQVIDFHPDVLMTFEATTIPDMVPVTITFRVDPAGPALRDVKAVYGG